MYSYKNSSYGQWFPFFCSSCFLPHYPFLSIRAECENRLWAENTVHSCCFLTHSHYPSVELVRSVGNQVGEQKTLFLTLFLTLTLSFLSDSAGVRKQVGEQKNTVHSPVSYAHKPFRGNSAGVRNRVSVQLKKSPRTNEEGLIVVDATGFEPVTPTLSGNALKTNWAKRPGTYGEVGAQSRKLSNARKSCRHPTPKAPILTGFEALEADSPCHGQP